MRSSPGSRRCTRPRTSARSPRCSDGGVARSLTEIWSDRYGYLVVKTTLNLDDQIFRAAKKLAAERGVTLTHVVEEALRAAVTEPKPKKQYRLRMVTVKGPRPLPVNVADRNALYEWMEGRA